MQKHFKLLNRDQIDKWRTKGLSNQYLSCAGTFGGPTKSTHVIFKGKDVLVQYDNIVIAEGTIVNIYIVYKTSPKTINSNFVFKNCLFGTVKITNTSNSDIDKLQYSGYGIGIYSKGEFTHQDGGDGKNVIISGADLSNSKHANNKTKHVLVFGREFIQKINDTTIFSEKMYSPNFTVDNKIFCLSVHYSGNNSC